MPNVVSTDPLYKSLVALRLDALERGMIELAMTYGWSAIKRGNEILATFRKVA
jgi:hypothetical protein